jgi:exonuclease SbcC
MQLDRLQMRNFKRYRDTEVTFREGITGILGNNGAGKSTIVEAILFCLFGVKETGLAYILSATAGKRDRAEVRLEFTVGGVEYQLVRSMGPGKKHEVRLHREKNLLAQGVSEVQHALRQVIRMGHADFRYTIFSGQRELLTLVEATPEERKRWFRKVLGIDSLKDEGGEILRGEEGAARDELLRIEGRLKETDADGIRRAMEEAGQGVAATDREISDLQDGEQALAMARASLDEEMKGHRGREMRDHSTRSLILAKKEEAAGMERDLGKIRGALAALEVTRREFQELLPAEAGFPALQERHAESMERARAFRDLMAREKGKRERITEIEEDLTRLRGEDARLARDEEKIRALAPGVARRQEILERLTGLRGLEERYRDIVAGIERKGATLEGLGRRGGILYSRIERMKETRARLIALAQGAGVPPAQEGDPIPFLEVRRQEIQQAMADKKAGRDQEALRLSELDENLSTLAAEGASGTCPTCRQPLGERYQDLVADIRRDIAAIRDSISARECDLQLDAKDLASLQSILDEAGKLREACSHLGEDSVEWSDIQEKTFHENSAKEQLEHELVALGYNPLVREELEKEFDTLENPWKESLAAAERLKGRPEVSRRITDLLKARDRLTEETGLIARERDDLGFDPDLHSRIEGEFSAGDRAHRRYLELKPGMDQVPLLLGQEKALLARLASALQALEGLMSGLSGIGFSQEDLERVQSQIEENSRQALEMGRLLERARAGKSQLERELTRLTDALGRLEEDTRNRDRLNDEIALLRLTRDQLNGFTDHLLGIVRDQIQGETGRILSEITDGRYDTVLLDDTFELLVHDLGGDFPVSRFSGGEQDDVAIALRIALSRYIAETHELRESTFLIFDEIFGSQDEERRGNIFRALRALEPYFPQIFLISHVADVQGEFGNTLVVEAVSAAESRIRDMGEGGA